MEAKLEFLFFNKYNVSSYREFHKHHCFELVYYINGSGSTIIDGKRFLFTKNTFCFMHPNASHDRSFKEKSEIISIAFSHNLPIEIEAGVYDDIDGKIYSYLDHMKQEFLDKKVHYQIKLNAMIVEIIVELDRRINTHKPTKDLDSLNYIKNYIDVHYNEKINLDSLAQLSFYSYHHFRHKFKEFTGLSPNQYVIRKRIEGAVEMLKNTDRSISEIAMDCGFSTTAQFCLLFKKHVSKTPMEYRNYFANN